MSLQRVGWWTACALAGAALVFDIVRWVQLYRELFSPPLRLP